MLATPTGLSTECNQRLNVDSCPRSSSSNTGAWASIQQLATIGPDADNVIWGAAWTLWVFGHAPARLVKQSTLVEAWLVPQHYNGCIALLYV